MPSLIDDSKPIVRRPTTASVRLNFAVAKKEVEFAIALAQWMQIAFNVAPRGIWDEAWSYGEHDLVSDGGVLYVATGNTTAGSKPVSTPSEWDQFNLITAADSWIASLYSTTNPPPASSGILSFDLPASESLTVGPVNVWNDSGTARVRKASAADIAHIANGCVTAAVASGATATVYTSNILTGLTGLTVGPLYLSTTPGAFATTPPASTGNVLQRVGFAISSSSCVFTTSEPFIRA